MLSSFVAEGMILSAAQEVQYRTAAHSYVGETGEPVRHGRPLPMRENPGSEFGMRSQRNFNGDRGAAVDADIDVAAEKRGAFPQAA